MLTNFKVSNYKCLVDVELPLTPIHVIIGQNDSGKTSLLEAMQTLSRTARMTLNDAFVGEWLGRELVNESSDLPHVVFEADYGEHQVSTVIDVRYHLEVVFHHTERGCAVQSEWIESPDKNEFTIRGSTWSSIGNRGVLSGESRNLADRLAAQMGPASLYRLDPKWMAVPASIDPERKFRLDADGFGLPTLLDDILGYDPQRFLDLRGEFCGFFPQFKSVRIETEQALTRRLNVAGSTESAGRNTGKGIYFETMHGTTIRAQQASDGAILFLGLLALIHAPNPPKLLLIEEPEKGVYPFRLEQLVDLIRRLHQDRIAGSVPQIIMTTHSPYLVSYFQPEEVTLMSRRDKTGSVRARPLRDAPHIYERLGGGEFYLGELWYNVSEEDLFCDA